jgi:putative sterol carrier protein
LTEITIQKLLELAPKALIPSMAAGVEATVQLHLTGDQGGDWMIIIEDEALSVKPGISQNPRIKLTADAGDVLNMANGKLDPMQAFMLGKLKISGDTALALKLTTMFNPDPALLNE